MYEEAPDPRLGTVVGRKWRLDAVLGQGAAGTVYAATDPAGARFALKILDPAWTAIPEVVRRFRREGQIASTLRHAAAVPVVGEGTTEHGEPFLVMELLSGMDLERYAEHRKLSLIDALVVADRVLDLLTHTHALGILHRDLKPQNVFVERGGTIRVLDFGIARIDNGHESLTGVGSVLGTPGYMAPEQARGEAFDVRSDLWAVGALLFFLVTGNPPRSAPSDLLELELAARHPVPALELCVPNVPRSLSKLVDKATSFDPEARFSDAAAMQAAVRATYAELAAPVRSRRSRADRRRDPRVASAFAVGLHARRGSRIGVCRSYARSGLLVATASRFAPGERVEVELPASCTGSSPLRARGRVVRVNRADDGDVFSELTVIELESPIPSQAHRRIAARLG